jgi:hypothetical protein
MSAYRLTVTHGLRSGTSDAAAFPALRTVGRTLEALAGHGAIVELEAFAGDMVTVWTFTAGNKDPAGIALGLGDLLEVIAPAHWRIVHDP